MESIRSKYLQKMKGPRKFETLHEKLKRLS